MFVDDDDVDEDGGGGGGSGNGNGSGGSPFVVTGVIAVLGSFGLGLDE